MTSHNTLAYRTVREFGNTGIPTHNLYTKHQFIDYFNFIDNFTGY